MTEHSNYNYSYPRSQDHGQDRDEDEDQDQDLHNAEGTECIYSEDKLRVKTRQDKITTRQPQDKSYTVVVVVVLA
jgi:hypothetical protein